MTLKILVVEDDKDQREIFESSAEVFKDKYKTGVEYEFAIDEEEAIRRINSSFDGAIFDLKLGNDAEGGNKIVQNIDSPPFRVPVIFVTGFPDLVNENPLVIKILKRADGQVYQEALILLNEIYNTGLSKIMGGRGIIEQTLNQVCFNNLLPQKNSWIEYGKSDPTKTEKALLRYTLNHLLQLLEEDEEKSFPEEFYIFPPLAKTLKTGSIVKCKADEKYYVVLNPPCDLAIRPNKKYKTDRILLAEIDDEDLTKNIKGIQNSKNKKEIKKIHKCKHHHDDSESYKSVLEYHNNSLTDGLGRLFRNSHDYYHHWLPQTDFFDGGFLNFRKLFTFDEETFDTKFEMPKIQIAPSFVKDILSRFSSYYARQGQPDIVYEQVAIELLKPSKDKN